MYVRLYFVFIFCLGKNIMKSIRGGFKLKIIFCVERGHGALISCSKLPWNEQSWKYSNQCFHGMSGAENNQNQTFLHF